MPSTLSTRARLSLHARENNRHQRAESFVSSIRFTKILLNRNKVPKLKRQAHPMTGTECRETIHMTRMSRSSDKVTQAGATAGSQHIQASFSGLVVISVFYSHCDRPLLKAQWCCAQDFSLPAQRFIKPQSVGHWEGLKLCLSWFLLDSIPFSQL